MEIDLVVDDGADGKRRISALSAIVESMKRANANSCDAPDKFC